MRILIYARVSSEDQVDNYSLTTQEKHCREAADDRGDEVVGVIRDEAEHGDDPDRPGLQELRDRLDAGEADGVYVLDLDRLHRDYAHHILCANELVKQGHHVYSVSDGADYANEDSRVLLDVKAAIAADELRKIRRHSRRGVKARIASGLHHGQAPFGYAHQEDKAGEIISTLPMLKDPEEAALVEELYRRYLNGASLRELSRDFTRRGIRGKRGSASWNMARIGEVLASPVYRGKVRHGDDLYDGQHEAIITDEQWFAVQDRREQRRASHHSRRGNSLSALMRCGLCGGPVRIATHKSPDCTYYGCSRRIERPDEDRHEPRCARAQAVEAVLWEWLRQLLTDNTLQQAAQRYQERLRAHGEQDRRTEVVDRLAAVENEIKFNVRAARAGTLPEDMLEAENAPLVKEREDLQRELERLERTSRLPDRDAEELLAMGRTALDRWETLEDAGRKLDFLERVFTHVELWGDRMRIHHVLDPLEPKDVALPTYWAPKRGVAEVDLDAAT